jgi:para-nitrobenzyl esterase
MAGALTGPRADDVVAVLRGLTDDPYVALDKLYTDVIWIEPAFATAQRFAALERRFFYYHFARVSPGARRSNELVKHSAEIRYVFGNLSSDGAYDTTDASISRGMQDAWIAFARTGIPQNPDGTAWPDYREPKPEMTWIEDKFETRAFTISELTAIIHSLRDPRQRK